MIEKFLKDIIYPKCLDFFEKNKKYTLDILSFIWNCLAKNPFILFVLIFLFFLFFYNLINISSIFNFNVYWKVFVSGIISIIASIITVCCNELLSNKITNNKQKQKSEQEQRERENVLRICEAIKSMPASLFAKVNFSHKTISVDSYLYDHYMKDHIINLVNNNILEVGIYHHEYTEFNFTKEMIEMMFNMDVCNVINENRSKYDERVIEELGSKKFNEKFSYINYYFSIFIFYGEGCIPAILRDLFPKIFFLREGKESCLREDFEESYKNKMYFLNIK